MPRVYLLSIKAIKNNDNPQKCIDDLREEIKEQFLDRIIKTSNDIEDNPEIILLSEEF
jgi:hypothetical protein